MLSGGVPLDPRRQHLAKLVRQAVETAVRHFRIRPIGRLQSGLASPVHAAAVLGQHILNRQAVGYLHKVGQLYWASDVLLAAPLSFQSG